MTNTIGPVSSGHIAEQAASEAASHGAAGQKPAAAHQAPPGGAARAGEAVTLSATSQTTAQLLEAARAADGVDQARVAQLRGAVQDGSYNVAPEDVARAIASAGIGSVPPATASGRTASGGKSSHGAS